jgi:hypothetical protein
MPFLRIVLSLWLALTPAFAGQSGLLLGVSSPGASGNCTPGTQATAFLARTSGLTTPQTNAVCTVINALFSTNVTTSGLTGTLGSNTCGAYFFALNNTTNASLNLVSTSFTLSVTGTTTFSPSVGWAGDGSTGVADTSLVPGSACPSILGQNSIGITQLVQTNRTSSNTSVSLGVAVTGSFNYMVLLQSSDFFFDLNAATFPSVSNTTTKGGWGVDRTSLTASSGYHNGSSTAFITASDTSTTPPSNSYQIFALSSNGSTIDFSTDQISCVGIHAGFNGADEAAWQNACNAGLQVLGVNVY